MGCGCILPILLILAVAGFGFVGAKRLVQGNDAFAAALDLAQQHPDVIDALGEPIKTKLIGNNFNLKMGQEGGTTLSTSCGISGPKGEAQLSFEAIQIDDEWVLEHVDVELGDGRTLQLLAPQEPTEPTSGGDALQSLGRWPSSLHLELDPQQQSLQPQFVRAVGVATLG